MSTRGVINTNIPNMNVTFTDYYFENYFPNNPKVELLPNTTYRLSYDYVVNSATAYVGTGIEYGNNGYLRDIKHSQRFPTQTSGRQVVTFTTPSTFEYNPSYLAIRFARIDSRGSINVDISNVVLEILPD